VYEEKDTYQEIIEEIPHKKIFLGSIASRKRIEHENIEWIIEILSKDEYCDNTPKTVRNVYRFEFEDLRSVELYTWIERIIPIMYSETGNGLIHCREGRSRSASILIAYLIKYKNMTYDDAFNYIQSKRQIIKPNIGFIKQLKQYMNSHSIQSPN
jgi:protein-tyrosine phosphatase